MGGVTRDRQGQFAASWALLALSCAAPMQPTGASQGADEVKAMSRDPAADDVPKTDAMIPADDGPTDRDEPDRTDRTDRTDESAELEVFEGRFDIDRLAQGKRLQVSSIELDDGEQLILSYRPLEEHYALVERRVVARGRTYRPQGQAIGGHHVRLESMHLAEGERPIVDVPTTLPEPPKVRSGAELRARMGRWVQLSATLVGDRSGGSGVDWRELEFRLADGTEFVTFEADWVVDKTYRPHFGAPVTALGKVIEHEGKLALGPVAICAGDVDGCGMLVPALSPY